MRLRWENFGGWAGNHNQALMIAYALSWMAICIYEDLLGQIWAILLSVFGGAFLFYGLLHLLIWTDDKYNTVKSTGTAP